MQEQIVQEQSQQGKQITIYAFFQPNMDWQPILQEITTQLATANVQPSFRPIDDHALQGSNYISYRYQAENNIYGAGYNPGNLEDPFTNIIINVDAQPAVPIQDANPQQGNEGGCCNSCSRKCNING